MSRSVTGAGSPGTFPATPGPQSEGVSQTNAPKEASESKSSSQASQTSSFKQPESKSTNQEPKTKVGEFKLSGNMQQALLSSQLNTRTLQQGTRGADVEKLQDFLISKGYMTADQKATGPGQFGPRTEAALRKFQKDHGLKDDGICGPKTRKSMEESSGQVAPKKEPAAQEVKKTTTEKPSDLGGTKEVPDSQLATPRSLKEQAEMYDKYSMLIPEGKLKDGQGEMNIVGLRHHDIESRKDLKSYDDRFAVLWKDEAGNKRISVFQGATHTGQTNVKGDLREDGTYRAKFTDVNGDGRSDISYIKPGTYDFHLGKSSKYGEHLRPDQNIAAYRDTNQDGKITGDEKNPNYTAGGVLFHKGGTTAPRSVGCQTMAPEEFDRFMELIKQDPNDKVSYTLVDVSQ